MYINIYQSLIAIHTHSKIYYLLQMRIFHGLRHFSRSEVHILFANTNKTLWNFWVRIVTSGGHL